MKLSLALFALIPSIAQATIYFAAKDPNTGAIALVYSSSGGGFWQTRVKGKGIMGEGSYGLCRVRDKAALFNRGWSAEEIAKQLHQHCLPYENYRLTIITTDGKMKSFIAGKGCHSGNAHCGERIAKNFIATGGGLEKMTLDVAMNTFQSFGKQTPFHCRLFRTLENVYQAGGEKKDFRGASITIDHPKLKHLLHWESRGREVDLLPRLAKKMAADGYQCPRP